MALPRKSVRRIAVDGQTYLWRRSRDGGLVVQQEAGAGRPLSVLSTGHSSPPPSEVARRIRQAVEAGWRPEGPGPPFVLDPQTGRQAVPSRPPAAVSKQEQAARDWLASSEPAALLGLLRGSASDRKLRLFAVACCRRILHLMGAERSRTAVEVAERYADGLADSRKRKAARTAAWGVVEAALTAAAAEGTGHRDATVAAIRAADAAASACDPKAASAAHDVTARAADAAERALRAAGGAGAYAAWTAEKAAHARLLRELFGNPFRAVTVYPAWLTWNGGTVPQMAQTVYDGGRFELLPILADALEEAGCRDAEVLAHCRVPGEHVRGCWVVDLLLERD
jgi:hypothetical protein